MSIGFKEWAVVCEALREGRQCLILRKGGIAEGRDGFQFKHPEFFLFPTRFHEQVDRTILAADTELPHETPGEIEVVLFARVEWTLLTKDWERVRRLAPYHILREEEVRARFDYEGSGINVAMVRVFRLHPAWRFKDLPRFGGCRSWVDLPEAAETLPPEPVLDAARFAALAAEIREILEGDLSVSQ